MSPRVSTPAPDGSSARPKGEAKALANHDQRRGAVSGVLGADPIVEKMLAAVAARATELGVELRGRLWVKPPKKKGAVYEVLAGRVKLGHLSQTQIAQCDVADLFLLHRSVLLEISVPRCGAGHDDGTQSVTWADWSGPLRATQWALGRLMEVAIDELRLAARLPPKINPATGKPYDTRTRAYHVIASPAEQDKLRAEAAQAYARTHSEMWHARSTFLLGGGAASAAADRVLVQYKRWMQGEIGYPSWAGPNGALYVRGQEFDLTAGTYTTPEGEIRQTLVCRMNILGKSQFCAVRTPGYNAETIVRHIIAGDYACGGATLSWNDHKRRWQIQLSYTMPRAALKPEASNGCLAVRRSVDDLLYVMDGRGDDTWEGKVDLRGMGLKIITVRQQFSARKGDLHTALNAQGKNARGHGKKRFFRLVTRLRDKEARVIDSLLKQLASHIRRAATASNAALVLIEDYSTPWHPRSGDPRFVKLLSRMPWAQAEHALRCELEEHGIRLQAVSSIKDDTCPACGGATTLVDGRYMDCGGCGMFIGRVKAAAWHMFNAAGVSVDPTLARRASYATRALRAKQAKKAKAGLEETEDAAE